MTSPVPHAFPDVRPIAIALAVVAVVAVAVVLALMLLSGGSAPVAPGTDAPGAPNVGSEHAGRMATATVSG